VHFRRAVANDLHDAGVNDLTIQRVLRHSDVSVTRRSYIKRLPAQAVDAMKMFQANAEKAQKEAETAGSIIGLPKRSQITPR
jgi:hypothetical protein